jgi:basic membrane protein A
MEEKEETIKTKRPFLLLLALFAIVAMLAAACGGDDSDSTSESAAAPSSEAAPATEAASSEAATSEAASSEAASEPASSEEAGTAASEGESSAAAETVDGSGLKIGLVTDIGGLNDKGFNQLANEGLERAKAELGVTGEVRESKQPTDYVPNLSYFATQGYDLVIAQGFLMAKDLGTVAKQFPDTKFAIIDASATGEDIGGASNVEGLLFREQEAGYLVGYLAATLLKQGGFKNMNDKNTISSVGGIKIPPVDHFIAGYQAGAKAVDPSITTLNGYSNDFVDQAKCKELAADQIAKGSSVVFQVAGGCGLGALEAAAEGNVWGVGVDKDQSAEGPQVLTSAIKKVDEAVYGAIKSVADGSFTGGQDASFGVAEGAVGLGTVSPDVPQEALDAVDAQVEAIKAGSVDIPTEVP